LESPSAGEFGALRPSDEEAIRNPIQNLQLNNAERRVCYGIALTWVKSHSFRHLA